MFYVPSWKRCLVAELVSRLWCRFKGKPEIGPFCHSIAAAPLKFDPELLGAPTS